MAPKKIENLAVVPMVADGQYCPAQTSDLDDFHINLEVNSVKAGGSLKECLNF